MFIQMQGTGKFRLMQFVLAFMLAITPTLEAMPDSATASPLHQVAAVPMIWQIKRDSGPRPGSKSCVVSSRGGHVNAHLFKQHQATVATWSVRIGFENHPGSLRYLRIDKKYYQTDRQGFGGTEASEIVERLKSPGEFAYEWFKRPDGSKQGGLFGTGDFAAKVAECEYWVYGTRV